MNTLSYYNTKKNMIKEIVIMRWSISDVKRRGKLTFYASYWRCVLVALIIAVCTGSLSFGYNFNWNTSFQSMKDENGRHSFSQITGTYNMDKAREQFEELRQEIMESTHFWLLFATVMILALGMIFISFLISIFLLMPLHAGCLRFFREGAKERKYTLTSIGFAFSPDYLNVVKILFFMELKIFLWSLLLIIPGIIKAYEYRMIPFILGEDPGISSEEAFRRTKELMTGNKWRSFIFDLSFIGWVLLGMITCGILLIFYVNPYIAASEAELYLTLKGEATEHPVFNGHGAPSGNPPYGGSQYNNPTYGGQNGNGQYGGGQPRDPRYGNPPYGGPRPGNHPGNPPYNNGQYGNAPYGGAPGSNAGSSSGYAYGGYDSTGRPIPAPGAVPWKAPASSPAPENVNSETSASPSDTADTADKAPAADTAQTTAHGSGASSKGSDSPFNVPY